MPRSLLIRQQESVGLRHISKSFLCLNQRWVWRRPCRCRICAALGWMFSHTLWLLLELDCCVCIVLMRLGVWIYKFLSASLSNDKINTCEQFAVLIYVIIKALVTPCFLCLRHVPIRISEWAVLHSLYSMCQYAVQCCAWRPFCCSEIPANTLLSLCYIFISSVRY